MGTVIVDRGSTASVNQCAISANSANSAAGAAITAGQYAVDVATSLPYATQVALFADLAHDVDVKAFIWADTNSTKNGLYYKVGASGVGGWQKSDYAPLIVDDSVTTPKILDKNVTADKTNFADESFTPLSGYVWALTDEVGKIAFGVKPDGSFIIPDSVNVLRGFGGASGYAWGIVDENGRIPFGIGTNGKLKVNGEEFLETNFSSASGIAYGIVDKNGKMPFAIALDGNIIHKGIKIDLSKMVNPNASFLTPSSTITCWGDSLTNGGTAGVTTPYPAALAAIMGRTVQNKGISGMTSVQIAAKSGSKAVLLTVQSNTIPASGAVTITATDNANLSSKSNYGTLLYTGTLFGIHGTLSVGFNATFPDLPGITTFTRTTAGTTTLIPEKTPFIIDTGNTEFNTSVIWIGRNDIISGASNDIILANIDLMVNFLKPSEKRFIILGITNATWEPTGNAGHDQIVALNYALMTKYPRNMIDIRKVLVNSYNPSLTQDVADFGNDLIPTSLSADGLHLNDAGYYIVANTINEFLTLKGW